MNKLFSGFLCVAIIQLLQLINANQLCYTFCDEGNCTCPNNTYQCRNGQCIPFSKFQDRHLDCDDKSDEDVFCCHGYFKCDPKGRIGRCLSVQLLDDDKVDCLDQTDETSYNQESCDDLEEEAKLNNKTNNEIFYQCKTVINGSAVGKCIPIAKLLDSGEDCPEGDDEDPAMLDECLYGLDKCDPNYGLCTNIPDGGYSCTCELGYSGNGFICVSTKNIFG